MDTTKIEFALYQAASSFMAALRATPLPAGSLDILAATAVFRGETIGEHPVLAAWRVLDTTPPEDLYRIGSLCTALEEAGRRIEGRGPIVEPRIMTGIVIVGVDVIEQGQGDVVAAYRDRTPDVRALRWPVNAALPYTERRRAADITLLDQDVLDQLERLRAIANSRP